MKQQKGITLVALIITIIVMLILVAVTLSIALGENGIVNHGKNAAVETNEAIEYEKVIDQAGVNYTGADGETAQGINNVVEKMLDNTLDTTEEQG